MTKNLLLILLLICFAFHKKHARILVFTKTGGYRHTSIGAGKNMMLRIGAYLKMPVDTTEDASVFTLKNLSKYQTVVFMNTSGKILDSNQKAAFEQYISNGGNFIGIHAATDTEYDWPWYNKLVGAYFNGHPRIQNAVFRVADPNFLPVKHLPDSFYAKEEIYNFKSLNTPNLNVVVKVDETTYSGGKMGTEHPIAWWQALGRGRMFYTALGHQEQTYSNPDFEKMIANALLWLSKPVAK